MTSMQIKRIFFFAAICICMSFSSLAAQELSYSGSLSAQTGLGLPNTHDNKGKFLSGALIFDSTLKAYFNESMLYLDASLIGDGVGSQSTNGVSSFVSDDGHFSLKLKEAYFDYNGGFWALRAGRMIAAWGKADGIQITDILCPHDVSTMIATTYKESRQGIDALRLSYTGNSLQADVYWIPFFTPSTLPLAKNNPLKKILFPTESGGFALVAPDRYDDFDLPEKKLANSEYAARVGMYFSRLDLSFYGFYGWEDEPFLSYESNGKGIAVKGKYERMAMVGLDSALPAGDFVFRFEGAYFPQRYMQTNADWQAVRQAGGESVSAGERHHQLVGLAGFDWTPSGGWTITAQYIADYAFGDADALARYSYQHQASLMLEKTLLNDLITLSALAFVDLRDFSSNATLSAEYMLTDAIKLFLLGDIFLEGPDGKKGLYGAYRDLSCVTLKGKISF